MAKLPKKPNIVLSNIPEQNKRGANSLTIEEWNSVINKLKLQGDLTVRHLHQLHQLLVYSGSDIDDPYLDIELAPGGYGLLTDSVVKYRGEWDAVNNKPELLLVDKTKLGWMYTVGPNASLLSEALIPGLTYGDVVVYNQQGELTVLPRLPEEVIQLVQDMKRQVDNNSVQLNNFLLYVDSNLWEPFNEDRTPVLPYIVFDKEVVVDEPIDSAEKLAEYFNRGASTLNPNVYSNYLVEYNGYKIVSRIKNVMSDGIYIHNHDEGIKQKLGLYITNNSLGHNIK